MGETEGNLEQILNVLRAMGPVVVVIDEADAALGNREAGGDSGTSSRVFSMIASQMGDTRYRGKLLWMLLTSRPDLLPIDLKRQGRAEVHLPLFAPADDAEIHFMIKVMARKNKTSLAEGALPAGLAGRGLSRGRHREHRARGQAPRARLTAARRSHAMISKGPSMISSPQHRVWKRRNRSSPPCSSARRCRSCRNHGGRASPRLTVAPSSRNVWP